MLEIENIVTEVKYMPMMVLLVGDSRGLKVSELQDVSI